MSIRPERRDYNYQSQISSADNKSQRDTYALTVRLFTFIYSFCKNIPPKQESVLNGLDFEFGGVGAVLLIPGRDGSWQTLEFEFLADQMLCAETD